MEDTHASAVFMDCIGLVRGFQLVEDAIKQVHGSDYTVQLCEGAVMRYVRYERQRLECSDWGAVSWIIADSHWINELQGLNGRRVLLGNTESISPSDH